MKDDCIAVALGLPQLKILEQKELGEYFEVTVVYRREEASCPRCEQLTSKEHDRRLQWKQDRRLRDKVVYDEVFGVVRYSLSLMRSLVPGDGQATGSGREQKR